MGLVFLLPAFLLGLVGVTVIETQSGRSALPRGFTTLEGTQLTQAALTLQAEQEELKRQLVELRAQLDVIQAQAARSSNEGQMLQRRIDALKSEAGLSPLNGAGVIVTLDDARLPPTRDAGTTALAIVHSQDITDVINAAWKGGAAAIAINDERITGASACVGATIQINGTLMSPPFVISIVGPRDQLIRILDDPGELADLRARSRAFGLRIEVTPASDLRLPPYSGPLTVHWAQVQ